MPQAPFYGSTLFPGNRTREEFGARVQANLVHAVQVIGATPNLWQLDVAPEGLAARVLATLPASVELVALHSNPGPVHTFVHPDTLKFVGLIDFGDAYISHPALDWRWPTHADRVALLHGCARWSRKDNIKGQACLGCKRNGLGEKPLDLSCYILYI
jgi:hypothetical protein